jgi:hypothetical protein
VRDPKAQDNQKNLKISQMPNYLNGKKMLLFVEAQLLVFIPWGDNRLLPRRIALHDRLAHLDHPVVVSPSDVFAAVGETFRHKIEVRSHAGAVRFSVDKVVPQANLQVSKDGEVTWPVPPSFLETEINATIRVNDATGWERLHRLNILVR